MRRYELGMCLDYVNHWGIEDAIREFFQNCFDAANENPENAWYVDYNPDSKTVRIGNKKGSISINTLLLGKTSKKEKEDQIGKFGEGYKVGTVVLLRNGCSVTVYNYVNKEIWRAKIIQSRRYGEAIPVFDVEQNSIFKPIKGNDLIFEVTGIEPEMWEKIVERNLFLQRDIGEYKESSYGRVLLDEKHKGKIYVSGLYVCYKEQLSYGYDLSPKIVELDRDRGLVDSYKLRYELGKVIAYTGDEEFIRKSIGTWDGALSYIYNSLSKESKSVGYALARDFYGKWGNDAVPCMSQDEFNLQKGLGLNPIMLSECEYQYVINSGYVPERDSVPMNPKEKFVVWYSTIGKEYLPFDIYEQGSVLLKDLLESCSVDGN